MPEPTVPPWIKRAVVLFSNAAYPIVSWRATRTQVVVTYESHGRHKEARYYLNGLREVGAGFGGSRLVADDDPRAQEVRERLALKRASDSVSSTFRNLQFQYSPKSADELMTKLEALRVAVLKAQANLSEHF